MTTPRGRGGAPPSVRPLPRDSGGMLVPLVEAGTAEGFRFLLRLQREHQSGENRFEEEGEVLLGAFRGAELLAVGGLNRDSHSGWARTGRIRHLYVLPSHRRAGIGRLLVGALVERARPHFDRLVLRTDTAAAARFYEALGFRADAGVPGATHCLPLGRGAGGEGLRPAGPSVHPVRGPKGGTDGS